MRTRTTSLNRRANPRFRWATNIACRDCHAAACLLFYRQPAIQAMPTVGRFDLAGGQANCGPGGDWGG